MSKNGRLIYELVSASCSHPTAEEVFLLAKNQTPNIAMATVYNNLNKLVAEGKLRRICVAGSADHYDKAIPHEHLVCVKCGKLHDVQLGNTFEYLRSKITQELLSYELNLRYLCDDCKEGG